MSRYSSSHSPRDRGDRSRSPPRLSYDNDRAITVAIERCAAEALENDKKIFGRLKDLFKSVDVEQKSTEMTFFGPASNVADHMKSLSRYLENYKNIKCTRYYKVSVLLRRQGRLIKINCE